MKRNAVKTITWNGTEILELRIPESTIPHDSRYYTVVRNDTLDLIAFKFYRDESKYYLIADVNQIIDPLMPLEPGTRLVIP